MRVPQALLWFACSLAGALVALSLFVLVSGNPGCLSGESLLVCGREWTAALSGWAAAAGALIAVMLTLPALRQQVAEARAQTAFMLGDSLPTLDLIQRADLTSSTDFDFVITNWNRGHYEIRCIRIQMVGHDDRHYIADVRIGSAIEFEGVFVERKSRVTFRDTEYDPPISLPGWKNRSKQPPSLRYEAIIEFGDAVAMPAIVDFEVTINGKLSRAETKHIPLHATSKFNVTVT